MSSVAVTTIVVIAAIILFMILCIKGMGSIPAAFICVALVSIVADGGLVSNLTGTFITGMTANFATFFFLFSMGCAFGGLLSACGAADRLGRTFVKLLGQENCVYVILIVSILLGLCGVAPCALVPFLAYGMLRASNLPRYIGMVAVASGTTISYTLVPGTLAPPNVLAATILGEASNGATSIYAAPLYSICLLVFTIVLNCLYIHWLIKRARAKGLGYEAGETAAMRAEMRLESEMPSFLSSIVALAIPIVFSMVTILIFHWNTIPAALLGLTLGMLFLIVVNHSYFKGGIFNSIRTNVEGIQWNIISALAVCGFASVIANTSVYGAVIGKLTASNINPYVLTVIGALILGGLCADFIAGSATFAGTIGTHILQSGARVNVQVMQRLALTSTSVFDSLPHGGMVLLALSMFGYSHKDAYKYLVGSNIIVPLCTTIFGLILSLTVFG